MSMTTFAGMSGVNVLGQSSGSTEGFSDAMVGGVYRLYQDSINHLQFGLSLALPIGNQQATIQMLSAMGTYMNMRAPYAMQIGTGTVDLVPTLAYTGMMGPWSWGVMYRGRFALNNNNEGWQYGASNEITGWGGYSVMRGVTYRAGARRHAGPYSRAGYFDHRARIAGEPALLWRQAYRSVRRHRDRGRSIGPRDDGVWRRSRRPRLSGVEWAATWPCMADHGLRAVHVLTPPL